MPYCTVSSELSGSQDRGRVRVCVCVAGRWCAGAGLPVSAVRLIEKQ